MKAYIIVDVTITDPARYDDYRKLTLASLEPYEGNSLFAAVTRKRWREIGNRDGLSCWSFLPWKKQKRGGLLQVMHLRKLYGRKLQSRG